jgi:hypothetical protein
MISFEVRWKVMLGVLPMKLGPTGQIFMWAWMPSPVRLSGKSKDNHFYKVGIYSDSGFCSQFDIACSSSCLWPRFSILSPLWNRFPLSSHIRDVWTSSAWMKPVIAVLEVSFRVVADKYHEFWLVVSFFHAKL